MKHAAIPLMYDKVRRVLGRSAPRPHHAAIRCETSFGFLEAVDLQPTGLVRAGGWMSREWADGAREDRVSPLVLMADDAPVPVQHMFRTFRPDLALMRGTDDMFAGIVWTWLLPPEKSGAQLTLRCGPREVWRASRPFVFEAPHYSTLFNDPSVRYRGDLYGSGPPVRIVSEEVVSFARTLPGPLLDFGCGAGALMKTLQDAGMDTCGIELERPGISRETLIEEVRERIILYDGKFPLPYADGQFASSTAIEVIEHVTDFPSALMEIARVTRERFVMTVPDMSSIPTLFPHGVVPWHLLEGTHYNFFTQTSLLAALRPLFRKIQFARIGPRNINGTEFYTSLVAFCWK